MEKFKELSIEEMQGIDGGSWIRLVVKYGKKLIEIITTGEAIDNFTDGFSDGYNSVEEWKPKY
jgi:bacteriocin-like protein